MVESVAFKPLEAAKLLAADSHVFWYASDPWKTQMMADLVAFPKLIDPGSVALRQ